jgi:predicted nucleotide-binding protein
VDNLIDDLVRAARRCERAAAAFDAEPVGPMTGRLLEASEQVGLASSDSFLGYQASLYIDGLRPKRPGEFFNSEWGSAWPEQSQGAWREYSYEQVRDEIMRRARVADLDPINEASKSAGEAFEHAKGLAIPILDAILSTNDDAKLRETRDKIAGLQPSFLAEQFAKRYWPRSGATRDPRVQNVRLQLPHHLGLRIWLMERNSWGSQAEDIAKTIRQAVRYLQVKMELRGNTVAKPGGNVFIGHGGSPAWRDLKDFIFERLKLPYDEFNRAAAAGLSTKERLLQMLDAAKFAFLVMTAEDEKTDGTTQARANVIHESGLFQGRLGFERAIILLEEGCAEFTNIVGLTQIRFPKGNIKAVFEQVREVLEREKMI